MHVSTAGHIDVIRVWLSHHADIHVANGPGYTPLQLAQLENRQDIVGLLTTVSRQGVSAIC